MRFALLSLLFALVACDARTTPPTRWIVYVSPDAPSGVRLPIIAKASGTIYTRMEVRGFILSQPSPSMVEVTGSLSIASVIDAIVLVGNGAFDLQGARTIVAATLGYTADTLPDFVPFVVHHELE